MPCSRCGSGAAPLHGRCAQCGASVGSDTTPTAIGLATPLPFPSADATIPPVSDSVTQFSSPDDGLTQLGGTPPAPPLTVAVTPPVGTSTSIQQSFGVTVGHNFGSRYHIIRVLGIGGMGAVYQAWDQTLEV